VTTNSQLIIRKTCQGVPVDTRHQNAGLGF
jgi:hypothetical protein